MKNASFRMGIDVSFLGSPGRRSRRATGCAAAPRRSRRLHLECLEDRIALSTMTPRFPPALIQAARTSSQAAQAAATATAQAQAFGYVHSEFLASGNVMVNSTDGASYMEFQKVSAGWKMIAWHQYKLPGLFQADPVFVQDDWAADGSLTETIWNLWGHGPGTDGEYAQLLVNKDQITLTLYHTNDYPIYWGLQSAMGQDATATWTYARTKDGGVGSLLQYHVAQADTSWSADWIDQSVYNNSNYYASGWFEYYPNQYSISVPEPAVNNLMTYVTQTAVQQQVGNAPVALPPAVTVKPVTVDSRPADRYWDSAQSTSVTFVYQGPAKKNLYEQIYGRTENGKWVTTTDHTTAFISQTATYDKRGGNLLASSTTFTAANGQTATLNGTWTSGTSIDNATGIETGSNYLGFSSVTVQVTGGKSVKRFGVLNSDAGGLYATDAFNQAGTSIIQRNVAAAKGQPNSQTWTGSGGNLAISWTNPDPSTSIENSKYQLNAPHSDYSGYTMLNFYVALVKPIDFFFNNGSDVNMKTYTWRAFASYSSENGWNWNYREKAQTGREHLAQSDPSDQLPFDNTPALDQYWNVV